MGKVFKAIKRIKQDILPTQIDYTPEMKSIIKRILNIDDDQVDKKLNNHIKYLGLNDKTKVDKKNGIQYDIWGIGWDLVLTEGFHIRYYPLLNSDDVKKYKFPDPEDYLLNNIIEKSNKFSNDYFLFSLQNFTLFERSWLLWGYENVLISFYLKEKEINYLLDGITDFQVEVAKKIVKLNLVNGLHTGDDFGTQRGMIMSPEIWRKFFKNRYKKIWRIYKENNLPVMHHSCGNIIEIINDLIDIGLDVLTPIQPEAMEPELLSNKFGERLSFLGGISTQKTLPFGTPWQVKKEIIERIKVLGKYDGYIISPSHEVTSDCKEKNFLTMLETLEGYRSGKLKII
ncbi:MAG: uroporphyrinogen decarboxylase family protein [Candidatus Humimicrobiaceae bacterium]